MKKLYCYFCKFDIPLNSSLRELNNNIWVPVCEECLKESKGYYISPNNLASGVLQRYYPNRK